MQTGFLQPYPKFECPTGDGWNFKLCDFLYYNDSNGNQYRGIVGGASDGASTPRSVWSLYPPFGKYWLAAYLHDLAYRCMIEKLINGVWRRVQLEKDECDALLLDAMVSLGVDEKDRTIIYEAVKKFAAEAFLEDLAQPIIN